MRLLDFPGLLDPRRVRILLTEKGMRIRVEGIDRAVNGAARATTMYHQGCTRTGSST
jgi:hypothetical protein